VKILKEAAAAANKAVAIISYDEKPGIQAIATTAPDLRPSRECVPPSHASLNMKDHSRIWGGRAE
jgi:hypothetical protein